MKRTLLLFFTSLFFLACNNSTEDKSSVDNTTKSSDTSCSYALDTENTKFEWTAYKTTAKLGVKGTFTDIKFKENEPSKSLTAFLNEMQFTIFLNSVNSGNEERDGKLQALFFELLDNPETISGTIKEATGDTNSGTLVVDLNLNNIVHDVQMKYNVDADAILTLEGSLDLLNWKAEKAIESLHMACEELHTGEDGVSKTWSEMSIIVKSRLVKDCE